MDSPFIQAGERLWNAWLKGVDSWFEIFLKSPLWLEAAGKTFGASCATRARWNEYTEGVLAQLRLASKDDVDRIGASVHQVEAKVNELLLRMEEAKVVRDDVPVQAPAKGGKGRK